MSLAKRMLQEQWEAGFSIAGDPWRGVCPNCIADPALARYVSGLALIETCSFCGSAGPNGVTLEELFRYMGECLATEWEDPVKAVGWDGREGGWQIAEGTVRDSYDLLWELGQPLENVALQDEFVSAFDHEWVPRNPYTLAQHDVLAYSWEQFARYVREESRYLFLRTGGERNSDSELIEPSQFLDELQVSIANSGLVRRLPAGTRLFRARQHDSAELLPTPSQLGSPPQRRAPGNRMSPPGISMFYAAEDLETALAELRPEAPDRVATVAEWTTARELAYLDLVQVEVPSIFDMIARHLRKWLPFLAGFATEVSQPVAADAASIDYVPTQIVTEYVRTAVLASDGEPVRGIRYRSAVHLGGVSWVLFFDAAGCGELRPGWEAGERVWLGLDKSAIRHFQLRWHPAP